MISNEEKRTIAIQEAERCKTIAKTMEQPFCDHFLHVADVLRKIAEDYSNEDRALA